MAESAGPSQGRIFICYRQEESAYSAGWLFDRLAERFGGQVFKDVDSIEPGDDWVEVITRVVGSCDVLLALIGDRWLTITDEDGRRRLDDPDDFVRLEIEAALTRDVRVIPILVAGARMPRADELPPSLTRLVRRQALVLSPVNFNTSRLLRVLDTTLAEARIAQEDAEMRSAAAGQALVRSATELPEASERPERAESSPRSSVRPAAPATQREVWRDDLQVSELKPGTDEAEAPPDGGQPRDDPRYRDPVTLIVTALAAGATVGRKDSASSAVRDAYGGLKAVVGDKLRGRADADVVLARYEEAPERWCAPLEAELREAGADRDPDLAQAALALMRLVDQTGARAGKYAVDARGAQGVQVGDDNRQENVFRAPPGD